MAEGRWMFDRGSAALAAALPRLPHARLLGDRSIAPVYVCPLCLVGFTEENVDLLRQEHCPPKAVGGPVITLTCATCNHDAGPVQGHAVNRVRWQSFASRTPGTRSDVRISDDDGNEVGATIEWRDDAYFIVVDPSRSNPADHGRLHDALRAGKLTGFRMTGSAGYREDAVKTSELRDAYLALFALMGYRWALWPQIDTYRAQIADGTPDPRLFRGTEGFDDNFRGIVTMNGPVECAAVIAGRRSVFLPFPTWSDRMMDWLDTGGPRLNEIDGARMHPWPTDMPMLLDLQSP